MTDKITQDFARCAFEAVSEYKGLMSKADFTWVEAKNEYAQFDVQMVWIYFYAGWLARKTMPKPLLDAEALYESEFNKPTTKH